jgi:hypothetical protein
MHDEPSRNLCALILLRRSSVTTHEAFAASSGHVGLAMMVRRVNHKPILHHKPTLRAKTTAGTVCPRV